MLAYDSSPCIGMGHKIHSDLTLDFTMTKLWALGGDDHDDDDDDDNNVASDN